jgi:Chaperone of endosialidase
MVLAVSPAPDGGYANNNTAEGTSALSSLTSGADNTAIGFQALFSNTSGTYNSGEGFRALFSNTTGVLNTATGVQALNSNTIGAQNTATGVNALFSNTTASYNTANGTSALFHNTTGSQNTATGVNALTNNTTGAQNTANGVNTLYRNTTGSSNTATGVQALFNNTTGSGNITIGKGAGLSLTTGDNNIDIAADGVAGESGTIRIGTPGTHTTTLLSGSVGIGTTTAPTKAFLEVDSFVSNSQNAGRYFDGTTNALTDLAGAGHSAYSIFASSRIAAFSFDAVSDARVKRIEGRSDAAGDLNTLMKIEVTNYKYKDTIDQGNLPQKKVIGQQVEQVYPQAVNQHTDVVPDIYEQASVKDGWVQLASDLKVGERVRLIGEKGDEGIYEVLELREGAFRTAFQSATEKVFVYGREVKDFRTVDYGAITMLNVSATQQIKKEKDAEIAALKAANRALAQKVEALQARDQARETRLTRLENALDNHPARVVKAALDLE